MIDASKLMRALGPFFILFLLTQAFYWPTHEAGFVTDFTGLMERIQTLGWSGVPNSLGYPGVEPLLRFVQVVLYQLFGAIGDHWHWLYTFLHAFNAWLLFLLARQIGRSLPGSLPLGWAWAISLLFLLSPFQTEVVVWRVCLGYLQVTALMLASLWAAAAYWHSSRTAYLWLTHLGLLLALFSFELAIVGPFLLLVWAVMWQLVQPRSWKKVGLLVVPGLLLWIGYFLIRRWWLGDWIGYYGADVHLNTDPQLIASNAFKYFSKRLALVRYWPHELKMTFFAWLDKPAVVGGLTGSVLIIAIAILGYWKKLKPALQWAAGSLVLFLLAIAPAANLYCGYILWVENDRYGYFAAPFLALFSVLLTLRLPGWLRYPIWIFGVAVSAYFLWQTTQQWKAAQDIYAGLIADYRWEDADTVYVLAAPDNYRGILLFKDYSGEDVTVQDALHYVGGKDVEHTQFYQIGLFNMGTPADSIFVRQDSLGALTLGFRQYGNWWWRNGIGASDYNRANYTFRKKKWGECAVHFSPLDTSAVYIYAQGNRWQRWRWQFSDHLTE